MGATSTGEGNSIPGFSESGARKPRALQSSIRVLVVLVLACAAIFLAWRVTWESRNPVLAAAQGLGSPVASQRLAAVRAVSELGSSGASETLQPLCDALRRDKDPAVRSAAAQALGDVASYAVRQGSNAEAVRAVQAELLGALKDPEASVRITAAGALRILAGIAAGTSGNRGAKGRKAQTAEAAESQPTAIDPAAVNAALLELLGDRDAEVRQAALVAVSTIAPSVSGEPPKVLFAVAEQDESAANRAVALGALAGFRHGLDPLVPVLVRNLSKDEPELHDACMRALSRISPAALSAAVAPALIQALGNGDREARMRVISLLARISPDVRAAVPALIAVLNESIDSDSTAMGGRSAVSSYAGPAHEAARALARLAPGTPASEQAIASLIAVLRSGPRQRHASAAGALGQFGAAAAEAIPALIATLSETDAGGPLAENNAQAADALGQIAPGSAHAGEAVAALTAALKSSSIGTRTSAIHALVSFGPAAASAIPAISAIAANDPIPNVRREAASALEKLKGESK
jgi:HEAT repeat protein